MSHRNFRRVLRRETESARNLFASAALYLDFVSGKPFDSRITFTRISEATRIGPTGLIETVSAGTPRMDYDPLTLRCKGFLIEEQRINSLLYSEQFDNVAWTKSNASITPNASISPDGTLTADKLVENNTNNIHFIYQGVSTAANTTYSMSIYAKAAERTQINVQVGGIGWATGIVSVVDLNTGAVLSGPAVVSNFGNGIYKISITATTDGTVASRGMLVSPAVGGATSYQGNGTSGIYIWGAQLEAGIFPTTYIPTTTVAITRYGDVPEMTSTAFSSWYRADEGTVFVESSIPYTALGNRGPIRFDDTTDNNRIMIRNGGASSRLDGRIVTGGTSVANLETAATAISPNVIFKSALAYKLDDFAMSVNGAAAVTDNLGSVPTVSRLLLGDAVMTNAEKGSTIRRVAFFPRRMTNTELQKLSNTLPLVQ